MKYLIITILLFVHTHTRSQHLNYAVVENLLVKEMMYWKASNDSQKLSALLDKAEIYSSERAYKAALSELDRAIPHVDKTSDLHNMYSYKRMLNYFLSEQYAAASRISIQEKALEAFGKVKAYQLMRLVSLNETEQWSTCKQELNEICAQDDSLSLRNIEQLPTICNYRSTTGCYRLSGIIPGLGQIKAGFFMKGTTSFLIHAGLALFIAHSIYTGFYITALVSGGLPLLKFYNGGKRLSFHLAEAHNNKEINKLKKRYAYVIKNIITLP